MRLASIVLMVAMLFVAACGDGNDNAAPNAPPAAGMYDTRVEEHGDVVEEIGAVGIAFQGFTVVLTVPGNGEVSFAGVLDDDGTLHGSGDLHVADSHVPAEGEARFRDEGGVHVVTGSVVASDPEAGIDRHFTFTMWRPVDADASSSSGIYRFTLDPGPTCSCTSTIDFDFTVERLGNGRAGATTERGPDGTVLASFDGAGLVISPQGKLHLNATYQSPTSDVPAFLQLDGTLGPARGNGDTFFGFLFLEGPVGTWTAERLSETPAAPARP